MTGAPEIPEIEVDQDPQLPPLRRDLEYSLSDKDSAGARLWTIHDPVQHRYFQIDQQTRDLLQLWHPGLTVSGLIAEAEQQHGMSLSTQDIAELMQFVRARNLTHEDAEDGWSMLARRKAEMRKSALSWFAHNYIFFKIPLLRPQRFLRHAVRWCAPLYTRAAAVLICLAGVIGLYLASRQWDTFIGTFSDVFSLEGAILFGLALIVLKAAHEMGHAVTAARYGCYVPNMGIAFMVLVPLFYTDVTDSWRLSSRRKRLLIGAAGMIVELALACIATLFWVFLPDGTMRAIAFMVATTGWIMSLAFNLNPCMRFDGYYLLADLVGIDNLQPRAFDLGRWQLRRLLFAPDLEAPEVLTARMRRWMIFYAWATWIYRLILFTTIALLVYHFSFKLLGILLFALEIWYLIALPVLKEIAQWRAVSPGQVSVRRLAATSLIACLTLVAFVVPWSTRVEVPAIFEAADTVKVFPPRPAQIVSVEAKRGQFVEQSQPLLRLHDKRVESDIAQTKIRIDITRLRLARAVVDDQDKENTLVLSHELKSLQTRLAGLMKQRDELTIRAPISGTILELDPDLHPGRWLAKADRLALMSSRRAHVLRGYVDETSLYRIAPGTQGRFVPDDLTRASLPVRLRTIAHAGAASIDIPALASVNGGRVAVQPDDRNRLVPVTAHYQLELLPDADFRAPDQTIRGIIELDAEPESFAVLAWRQIANVLIRESGF
jgi:putative peptide zinc metalloprotease protein